MGRLLPFLLLLVPTAAEAVTLHVCVRNDGAGTFSNYDFNVHADCTPNSGDRTEPGPGQWQDLDPGEGTCITMNGLSAWNGYQYVYDFTITFQDTSGLTTEYGPTNIQLPGTTRYLGASGLSLWQPSLSDYISVSNDAPPSYSSISAYPNYPDTEDECYVYWTGLTSAQVQDWNYNVVERSTSPSGPWTTVRTSYV